MIDTQSIDSSSSAAVNERCYITCRSSLQVGAGQSTTNKTTSESHISTNLRDPLTSVTDVAAISNLPNTTSQGSNSVHINYPLADCNGNQNVLCNWSTLSSIEEEEEEVHVVDLDDPNALEAHINYIGSLPMLRDEDIRTVQSSYISIVPTAPSSNTHDDGRRVHVDAHDDSRYAIMGGRNSHTVDRVLAESTEVKARCVQSLSQCVHQLHLSDRASIPLPHETLSEPRQADKENISSRWSFLALFRWRFRRASHQSAKREAAVSVHQQSPILTSARRKEGARGWWRIFQRLKRGRANCSSESRPEKQELAPLTHRNEHESQSMLTSTATTYATAISTAPLQAPSNSQSKPVVSPPVFSASVDSPGCERVAQMEPDNNSPSQLKTNTADVRRQGVNISRNVSSCKRRMIGESGPRSAQLLNRVSKVASRTPSTTMIDVTSCSNANLVAMRNEKATMLTRHRKTSVHAGYSASLNELSDSDQSGVAFASASDREPQSNQSWNQIIHCGVNESTFGGIATNDGVNVRPKGAEEKRKETSRQRPERHAADRKKMISPRLSQLLKSGLQLFNSKPISHVVKTFRKRKSEDSSGLGIPWGMTPEVERKNDRNIIGLLKDKVGISAGKILSRVEGVIRKRVRSRSVDETSGEPETMATSVEFRHDEFVDFLIGSPSHAMK